MHVVLIREHVHECQFVSNAFLKVIFRFEHLSFAVIWNSFKSKFETLSRLTLLLKLKPSFQTPLSRKSKNLFRALDGLHLLFHPILHITLLLCLDTSRTNLPNADNIENRFNSKTFLLVHFAE